LRFKSDYYSVFFVQFIIPFFKMGAIFGKSIPVHKVTTEMLRSHKTCSFSKNQLLTPRMCSLVLKKTSDRTLKCREREVIALKDFLDSQHNFVDKVTFPLPRQKSRLEAEICAAAKAPDRRTLSRHSRHHLTRVLQAIYSSERHEHFFRHQLLSDHILVALEAVYKANSNTSIVKRYLKNGLWRLLSRLWERVYQPPLQAESLRRKCSGITTKPGQEIAHKLSLYLAAHLWRHTNGGHRSIRMKDHRKLRHALSRRVNVYHTCPHTNRTLHVQYDNEIAKALADVTAENKTRKLSTGAKIRVKQVIGVLEDLQDHSDTMLEFCKKSRKLLRKLL